MKYEYVLSIDRAPDVLANLCIANMPVNTSTLREVIPNYTRLLEILAELENYGLVEVTYETSPRRQKFAKLTSKGKMVASQIIDIENFIRNG